MTKKINRILLNGVDYTTDVQGINDIVINYSLDEESRSVLYATSSEIVLKFDAYTLVKEIMFDSRDGCERNIQVTLVLGCCGEDALTFEINFRTIAEYCPAICEITTRLQERTAEQTAYDCLLNSIYWQDAEGQVTWLTHLNSYQIPKLEYCSDVKGIIPIILGFLILLVIDLITSFGTLPLGFGIAAAAILAALLAAFIASLAKYGCGKFHPAVPFQAIIDYSMLRCGLEFVSDTIFGLDPYGDLHLIQCQYVEGEENVPNWVPDNAANLNFIQIMDNELPPVFNSDFRIRNGQFIYERKDEFLRNLPSLGDIDDLYRDGCAENPPCYRHVTDRPFAIGRFEYTPDAIDTGGNEVANRVYSDLVDWNTPPREIAKGQATQINNFSPLNYIGMGEDSVNADIDPGSLIGKWYLKQGVSSQLKLFVLNPQSDINDATPIGHSNTVGALTNYPLWYDEMLPEQELYKNFHIIDDPRNEQCPSEADDFEFAPANFCELSALVRANGPDVRVRTIRGDMKPEEVEVNYENQTIILKGLRTFYVAP